MPEDAAIHLFHSAMNSLSGCRHPHQSRPFTLRHHTYKVCLDCGIEIPYPLVTMSPLKRNGYSEGVSVTKTARVGAL
jgi:hypothetical protein